MNSDRHTPLPASRFKDDAPVSATLDDLLDRITLLALLRDDEIRTARSERELLTKRPPPERPSLALWVGVTVFSAVLGGITAVNKIVAPEPDPFHAPLLSGAGVAFMLGCLGMATASRPDEATTRLTRREKIAREYDVMIFDLTQRSSNFDGITLHRFDDTPKKWDATKRSMLYREPFTLQELESGKRLALG